MPWPTDDLLTDKLDELSDNPVESLPQIYDAVQKIQEILAELTEGDTVLSAENASANNIAKTGANTFSGRQTINTLTGGPLTISTTDPDWYNVIDFQRAGNVNEGFRMLQTAPGSSNGRFALQIGDGASLHSKIDMDPRSTAQLIMDSSGGITYGGVSLINNAKPKGDWDEGQINGPFTNGVWKNTGGSVVNWTPTGDYNRIMVCATVEWPNGGTGGGATMSLRVTRNNANFRTQQMWAEEAQQGNATIFIMTSSTAAATWRVEMMHDEGFESRVANAQFRTTLGIWEVNV